MNRFVLAVIVLLVLAPAAFGDLIHLRNGRTLEGEIVSRTDESITLKMKHGNVEIFKSQIKEIEKKPLPAEVYKQKAAALTANDVDGHYILALWCKMRGLDAEYSLALEKVIAISPDHAAARRALGFVRKGGKWVKEKARPELAAPDPAKAVEIVKTVLSLPQPEGAKELIEKLRSFDGMTREGFNLCVQSIREWRSYKPVSPGEQEVKFSESGLTCSVSIPEGYNGKKAVPVLLSLHGSGQTSEEILRAWKASAAWTRMKKECILVAPQGESSYWWKAEATIRLDALIEELKGTYNVDTNRVYLSGFSNGGHGTWHYGLRRPDIFAAIAPDSGLPLSTAGDGIDFRSLKNALNLPLYIINGKEDPIAPGPRVALVVRKLLKCGCTEVVRKELPGGRRIHAVEAWGEAYEWLLKHYRSTLPKKVQIHYDGTGAKRACWVELIKPEPGAKVSAEVRKGYIEINASGAAKVIVFLSDGLVDLDKKVTVRLNNKRVYQDSVKRSPASALETCLARNDRSFAYAVKLSFDLK